MPCRAESCPICQSTASVPMHEGLKDRVFAVAPGGWNLVKCDSCGACRLDPRPSDDEISGLYADYYTHVAPTRGDAPRSRLYRSSLALVNGYLNANFGYQVHPSSKLGVLAGKAFPPFAAIAQRRVRSLPRGQRVLDIGCANGEFVAKAQDAGWAAVGIDIDEKALAAGRSAGLDLRLETIDEHAAAHSNAYDAITLSHLIEHVPDPIAVLRSCYSMLRSGGYLWVATPNLMARGAARFGPSWVGLEPPRHLVLFTRSSLTRALSAAGFGEIAVLPQALAVADNWRISRAVQRGFTPAYSAPQSSMFARIGALLTVMRDQSGRGDRSEELVLLARKPV